MLFLAKSEDIDPFCKLILGNIGHPKNQRFRFCEVVMRSSYFKNDLRQYQADEPGQCSELEVSFRTQKDNGKKFYELMAPCLIVGYEGIETYLYISRGYMSKQVFVYREDPVNDAIYLENVRLHQHKYRR